MPDKNYGLELYKLIMIPDEDDISMVYVSELGWINDNEFCVWIKYHWLNDFIDRLKEIFGHGIFNDGGFNANIQSDGVCIDLYEALSGYIDIETVFPKEKYKH